jgi:cyclic-di-GMP-binding protein
MPSFDIVSQINLHELTNAIDQTNREVSNRFDFKGTNSRVESKELVITLIAPAEFQIKQINDILQSKMSRRGIDLKCLSYGTVSESNNEASQEITVKQGIDKETAKIIIKIIKDSKLKVQTNIQSEQVRVVGKKRDDLQTIIALLKKSSLDLPLQFINYRD